MSGSWGTVTDSQGRYRGAELIEHGGDAEEFARDVFGMVWWLAAQLAALEVGPVAEPAVTRAAALPWVRVAEENTPEGFGLGGRAGGEDEEY